MARWIVGREGEGGGHRKLCNGNSVAAARSKPVDFWRARPIAIMLFGGAYESQLMTIIKLSPVARPRYVHLQMNT